jgi:hypothetical protein
VDAPSNAPINDFKASIFSISSRYYREILQEFVWVLASRYFAGAAALVGAVLYAHLFGKSPVPVLPETARCLQVPQM